MSEHDANEDHDQIDHRGRAAAAAVRLAVADKPVPEFDPTVLRVNIDAPTGAAGRSRRRGAVVAVAAAFALVAAGVGAVALSRGGENDSTATTPRTDLLRYGLGALPEGYSPLYVLEGDTAAADGSGDAAEMGLDAGAVVFGPSESEPRLAVAVLPAEEGGADEMGDGGVTVTTVEGNAGDSFDSGPDHGLEGNVGDEPGEPGEPRGMSGSGSEASESSESGAAESNSSGSASAEGSASSESNSSGGSSETSGRSESSSAGPPANADSSEGLEAPAPSGDPQPDASAQGQATTVPADELDGATGGSTDADVPGEPPAEDYSADDALVDEETDWTEGMTETQVGDRKAWLASDVLGASVGSDATLLVEVDGQQVLVIGASEPEVVRAVAALVTIDGDQPVVPEDALPSGWQPLRHISAYELLGGVTLMRAGGAGGWAVMYVRQSESAEGPTSEGGITLTVSPGTAFEVEMMRVFSADVEDVEVRGHDALLSDRKVDDDYGLITLRWEERPGEVIDISAFSDDDLDRDDLLAAAESIVALDDDSVAELRREALRGDLDAGGMETIGEGQFSDGSEWVLAGAAEPGGEDWGSSPYGVELRTTASGGSGSWGMGFGSASGESGEEVDRSAEAFPAGVNGSAGDAFGWLYGLIGPDVARVEIRDADGAAVAEAQVVGDGDLRGWVAEIPSRLVDGTGTRGPRTQVVAIAADGTELADVNTH